MNYTHPLLELANEISKLDKELSTGAVFPKPWIQPGGRKLTILECINPDCSCVDCHNWD